MQRQHLWIVLTAAAALSTSACADEDKTLAELAAESLVALTRADATFCACEPYLQALQFGDSTECEVSWAEYRCDHSCQLEVMERYEDVSRRYFDCLLPQLHEWADCHQDHDVCSGDDGWGRPPECGAPPSCEDVLVEGLSESDYLVYRECSSPCTQSGAGSE